MDFILTTKEELSNIIVTAVRSVLSDQESVAPTELKPENEIISIEEACDLLNLAKPTIYTRTSKGTIPHFKRGKKLYFRRSELLAWIDEGRRNTIDQEKAHTNNYLSKNRKGQ